jgi:hypothetical protein
VTHQKDVREAVAVILEHRRAVLEEPPRIGEGEPEVADGGTQRELPDAIPAIRTE